MHFQNHFGKMSVGSFLCLLTMTLDGMDIQLLGLAIPSLTAEWQLESSAFAPFIVVTVVLMSTGTAFGGWLGDRFGRKPVVVCAMLILGAFTFASGLVANLDQLLLLRGLASLGMGAVMPNAVALLAEFAPSKRRNVSVAIGISAVAFGGVLCGLLGSLVIPALGWRAMFILAGVLTFLVCMPIAMLLPESPALNVATRSEQIELHVVDKNGLSIFGKEYRRDTFALWFTLFFSMLGTYSLINWSPALMAKVGHGLAASSLGLAMFNCGCIFGAFVIAFSMDRFGSRLPLLLNGLAGGLVAALSILATTAGAHVTYAIISLTALGFCLGGMQASVIAFSSQVYPAAIRSTGMGATIAVGRFGALASSITGTLVLGLGAEYFLLAVGGSLALAGLISVIVRQRIATPASDLLGATPR